MKMKTIRDSHKEVEERQKICGLWDEESGKQIMSKHSKQQKHRTCLAVIQPCIEIVLFVCFPFPTHYT